MTDFLDFEVDLGDADVASTFDDLSYWASLFGQILLRYVPLRAGVAALDVGCGTGFPLFELADALGPSSTVHGVDVWPEAVERALLKARIRGHDNVSVQQVDASDLPYEDSSYDLLVSNLGINNFANPQAVMSECVRVLQRGGVLAITTNLVGHMDAFYTCFEESLVATDHRHLVDALAEHVAHRATKEGLVQLFQGAGLSVSRCEEHCLQLRYADGSALLRAYLSRVGFLAGWRSVLSACTQERAVFEDLEKRLNRMAERGAEGLRMTIPALYIEGRKA